MDHNILKIITKICEKEEIKLKVLANGLILALEKEGVTKYINNTKNSIDDYAKASIMEDQYTALELLKHYGLPVVEANVIFDHDDDGAYAFNANRIKAAYKFLNKHSYKMIMKGNDRGSYPNVYLITDEDDVKPISDKLFARNKSISIMPFYRIKNEYHAVIYDGNIEILYQKVRAVVKGDGESSLMDLLADFNEEYYDWQYDDPMVDLNKIIPKDEEVIYEWQYDLKKGGKVSFKIPKLRKEKLIALINEVVRKIDLKVLTLDIIEINNSELAILKVGSKLDEQELLDIYPENISKVRNIYEKIIHDMFK